MPPAERIPSSVRPKGKRPRVRVWYSSSTKARISTRLASMVFWSYSLILPSPVLTLEPPAASQEMGVGAEATDHPLPTAVSKTMSREGKDKCGPLLSFTLWSPVCWKTQTDSNTLCWDRTLELQMLSCIWNTFSTKVWRVLKCTISGYYFFFFNLQKQCWLRTYTELVEFQSCHLLAEGPLAIHRKYLLLGVFIY